MEPGQMETTFIKQACRAANLRSLLRHEGLQDILGNVIAIYKKVTNEDPRGTRIRDALTLQQHANEIGIPSGPRGTHSLDDQVFKSLLTYLNKVSGFPLYADDRSQSCLPGQLLIGRTSIPCDLIKIGGVSFKPERLSLRDSNLLFSLSGEPNNPQAGRIVSIFTHERPVPGNKSATTTFLVVRRLVALTTEDKEHDDFRRYKSGGFLCYDRYEENVDIVSAKEVLCHFARTTLSVSSIGGKCVHVLPLDRVSTARTLWSWLVLTLVHYSYCVWRTEEVRIPRRRFS